MKFKFSNNKKLLGKAASCNKHFVGESMDSDADELISWLMEDDYGARMLDGYPDRVARVKADFIKVAKTWDNDFYQKALDVFPEARKAVNSGELDSAEGVVEFVADELPNIPLCCEDDDTFAYFECGGNDYHSLILSVEDNTIKRITSLAYLYKRKKGEDIYDYVGEPLPKAKLLKGVDDLAESVHNMYPESFLEALYEYSDSWTYLGGNLPMFDE